MQGRSEGSLLFQLIPRLLVPGVSQDDVKLEVLNFLINMLSGGDMSRFIAAASTPPSCLIQLIVDHVAFESLPSQDGDYELLFKSLCLFEALMNFKETSAIILQQDEIEKMEDSLKRKRSDIIQHPRVLFIAMSCTSHPNSLVSHPSLY